MGDGGRERELWEGDVVVVVCMYIRYHDSSTSLKVDKRGWKIAGKGGKDEASAQCSSLSLSVMQNIVNNKPVCVIFNIIMLRWTGREPTDGHSDEI